MLLGLDLKMSIMSNLCDVCVSCAWNSCLILDDCSWLQTCSTRSLYLRSLEPIYSSVFSSYGPPRRIFSSFRQPWYFFGLGRSYVGVCLRVRCLVTSINWPYLRWYHIKKYKHILQLNNNKICYWSSNIFLMHLDFWNVRGDILEEYITGKQCKVKTILSLLCSVLQA
jgi:hypothetical protein